MPHIITYGRRARKAIRAAQKKASKSQKQATKHKRKLNKSRKQVKNKSREISSLKATVSTKEIRWLDLNDYLTNIGIIIPDDPLGPGDPNVPDDPNRPEPSRRDCIDFEDLSPTKEYPHGNTFVSEGVKFEVIPESSPSVKLPSDPSTSGKVFVNPSPGAATRNCPHDFGQSIWHNNVLVKLDVHQMPRFPNGAPSACFNYCDTGGHVYLRINGRSWDFSGALEATPGTATREMKSYHGLTLGGVKVCVTKFLFGATSSSGTMLNDHWGIVYLIADSDSIHTIEVGGQEFHTDRWCVPCREVPRDDQPQTLPITGPDDRCIQFEDLVPGSKYHQGIGVGSQFSSHGYMFEAIAESDAAVMLPFDPSTGGHVQVEVSPGVGLRNCPHEFGQYIMHNNCLVKFDVTQIPEWISGAYTGCISYCDLGGFTYLRVNGEAWDFAAMAAHPVGTNTPEMMVYNGLTIGGVKIRVTKFAKFSSSGSIIGHHGKVYFEMDTLPIRKVEIGGQEFWTDEWCFPCKEFPPTDDPNDPPTTNPPTYDPPTIGDNPLTGNSGNYLVNNP